jgi:hypothetical protein
MSIQQAPEFARRARPVPQWTILQALENLRAEEIGYVVRLGADRFEAQTMDHVALGDFPTRALAALAVRAAGSREGRIARHSGS